MLTPVPPYAALPARLLALQAEALAAYVRHAKRPAVYGAARKHLRLWAASYEARAAFAEQNPAFAQTLLPAAAGLSAPNRLPLIPAGVRWAVDESAPNTVTLTVDVTGIVTFTVTAPGRVPFAPPLTYAPTRATATFAAPVDGLYAVTLSAGKTILASLLVPVTRTEFGLFREQSRALAFAFKQHRPTPSSTYLAVLARLIGAEAAAQTGQKALALALLLALRGVRPAATPTALFPFVYHD